MRAAAAAVHRREKAIRPVDATMDALEESWFLHVCECSFCMPPEPPLGARDERQAERELLAHRMDMDR
jgi:hypothetical protein